MTDYRVIYADPPWQYKDTTLRFALGKREKLSSAVGHYQVMLLEDIKSLDIPAADQAYLFLWATNPLLREAFEVMESWGFNYKTTLTWVKPSIRMGYYFRGRTEHLLFGVKGKPGRLKSKSLGNVIEAKPTRHSEKPEKVYELIETACDGPYLEMFARKRRYGWDVWGNEAPTEITPMKTKLL